MPSRSPTPPCCLTIAGSDSGGGAGIQADLKTFRAHGTHGLSVITAITAQNTQGVSAVYKVPPEHIRAQIAAVFDDFPVTAVKIGMLGDAHITRLVADEMRRRQPAWLVVDPVMIATSGARLLDEDAVAAMIDELIPLADILTPNLPEAEALLNQRIREPEDHDRAGQALMKMGARTVLLKGGHAHGNQVLDRYHDASGIMTLAHPRLVLEGHGTGCTLSSAIAAGLARKQAPRVAVRHAVDYVQQALACGYQPGNGDLHVLRH
ncbi:MAG TPA: bifunctional hydroxymethylpyrimidine kinase/phosphomethylpyrimidine kinase [Oleiagrimonas sp.]|nr:bifunctional hydroxymethylpyrimidine kinase/phosphomethylpyrimidine kinase [Oleiagrimonas sp.]